MPDLTIVEIKERWNDVLDIVLESDRIVWLAFFDARIVSVENGVITLNFSDPQKFSGDHNFSMARNPRHIALLQGAIERVFGQTLEIAEK